MGGGVSHILQAGWRVGGDCTPRWLGHAGQPACGTLLPSGAKLVLAAIGTSPAFEPFLLRCHPALQHRGDHVMCFLVGLEKARKAVAACRLYGWYDGASADSLYEDGRQAMQRVLAPTQQGGRR